MKLFSVLQLMRPANIITAIADIIAGIAIAGFLVPELWNQQVGFQIILLMLSTIGLYGGGIVFNDVFDIEKDKMNRPERVIPSGRVSLKQAVVLGIGLLVFGIFTAFLVSVISGLIAISIAFFALLYDKYAKHHTVFGPISMGVCRGGNLILGMSINASLPQEYWLIGIIPIIFVAAITLTAQKESKGKNKRSIAIAMLLDLSIVIGFVLMSQTMGLSIENSVFFIILWYGINLISKLRAILNNKPKLIMKAVKFGVLSLIPLNASYTAGFSSVTMAVLVLCLLPISLYLSKKFPVT